MKEFFLLILFATSFSCAGVPDSLKEAQKLNNRTYEDLQVLKEAVRTHNGKLIELADQKKTEEIKVEEKNFGDSTIQMIEGTQKRIATNNADLKVDQVKEKIKDKTRRTIIIIAIVAGIGFVTIIVLKLKGIF